MREGLLTNPGVNSLEGIKNMRKILDHLLPSILVPFQGKGTGIRIFAAWRRPRTIRSGPRNKEQKDLWEGNQQPDDQQFHQHERNRAEEHLPEGHFRPLPPIQDRLDNVGPLSR